MMWWEASGININKYETLYPCPYHDISGQQIDTLRIDHHSKSFECDECHTKGQFQILYHSISKETTNDRL